MNRSVIRLFKKVDVGTHCYFQRTNGFIRCFATRSQENVQEDFDDQNEKNHFLKNEIQKYHVGKRWLARMMGEDPENFTQKDIDKAIQYLLPSGIYAKDARPILKHPYDLFPKTKESRFDEHGRPLSSAFYTGKPKFYDLTYQVWELIEKLDAGEPITQDTVSNDSDKKHPKNMQWMKQFQLEQKLNEKLNEKLYETIMFRLKKLAKHDRAAEIHDFFLEYQIPISTGASEELKDVELYDGVARAMGYRKTAIAEVIVRPGDGRIIVNGKDYLDFFQLRNDREQIMFPLSLTDSLTRFDIEANIIGGGTSGKSGAVRLGISRAIAALCPEHLQVLNEYKLLIRDYRQKERKKPGRKKARRAFQWVKR